MVIVDANYTTDVLPCKGQTDLVVYLTIDLCGDPGGRHASSRRERARQQKEDREAVLRASNYLSASRQIENLLCTARESLLGSGAWNKEFYSELQARPFYQSISTTMCIGTGGGGSARKGITWCFGLGPR